MSQMGSSEAYHSSSDMPACCSFISSNTLSSFDLIAIFSKVFPQAEMKSCYRSDRERTWEGAFGGSEGTSPCPKVLFQRRLKRLPS